MAAARDLLARGIGEVLVSRGLEPGECLRWVAAAGAGTAMTPGTELCHRQDVERLLPQIIVSELPA